MTKKVSKFQSFKVFILVNLFLFGCRDGNKGKSKKEQEPQPKPRKIETPLVTSQPEENREPAIPSRGPEVIDPQNHPLPPPPRKPSSLFINKDGEDDNVEDLSRFNQSPKTPPRKKDKSSVVETTKEKSDKEKLEEACASGDLETVKDLLQKGVDSNFEFWYKKDPLLWAVGNGHKKIVELLLENVVDPDSFSTRSNETPLGLACNNGDKDLILKLINHGADVFKKYGTLSYDVPLDEICENGFLEVVKHLVEETYKNDATNRNKVVNDALKYAVRHCKNDIVDYLVGVDGAVFPEGVLNEIFRNAVRNNLKKDTIEKFYNTKSGNIDIDSSDFTRSTPLMIATKNRNAELVEFLLDKNANVGNKNCNGFTALFYACLQGYDDIIDVLINKVDKSNINEKCGPCGATSLHEAIKHPNLETVKKLINKEADVNIEDNFHSTSLHEAVDKKQWEILGYLLTECGKNGTVAINWNKQKVKKDGGGEQSFRQWFSEQKEMYDAFKKYLNAQKAGGIEGFLDGVGCPAE